MESKEWTFVDRTKWLDRGLLGPGPWDHEPDKTQFVDAATGLPCITHRGPHGGWCGYVGVPPSHPFHGKSYNDPNVDVHGGLTYGDFCQKVESDDGHGVCHVPAPGEPENVFWFGFDCAHAGDLCPAYDGYKMKTGLLAGDVYRTLPYVKEQCAQLARQLAALA